MAKNELTTTETTALAETNESLTVAVDQSDMMIPFLKVIQSLSEEVVPGKDKYNPDVRPGDIYDGITRTIFKDSKAVICGIRKYYAEWTPEVRGTLCGKHLPDSPVVKTAVKVEKTTEKGNPFYTLRTAQGNDLIETYGVVMIIKDAEGLTLPAVLTLSKTSFVVGKQLSTLLAIRQMQGVPLFKLGTTSTSNTKGSWFKPSFTFDSYEDDKAVISMAQGMTGIVDKILFSNFASEGGAATIAYEEDDII